MAEEDGRVCSLQHGVGRLEKIRTTDIPQRLEVTESHYTAMQFSPGVSETLEQAFGSSRSLWMKFSAFTQLPYGHQDKQFHRVYENSTLLLCHLIFC